MPPQQSDPKSPAAKSRSSAFCSYPVPSPPESNTFSFPSSPTSTRAGLQLRGIGSSAKILVAATGGLGSIVVSGGRGNRTPYPKVLPLIRRLLAGQLVALHLSRHNTVVSKISAPPLSGQITFSSADAPAMSGQACG